MIIPTIGRTILVYHRNGNFTGKPEIAFICDVHSDSQISVAGFDRLGAHFALLWLPLKQDDDPRRADMHAEWMPYQVKVAKGEIPPNQHATPLG